jgi:parvulin-like peptidyl-prolyl isomerase
MGNKNFINIILVLGIFIGISLASISLIKRVNFETAGDWVANIEGAKITKEKYLLQLEGLRSDKRSPLTQKDKEFVLERMIEEELLIKRAQDMGMLRTNPMARGTLVQQMINQIISDNDMVEVSEVELNKFFIKNIGFFTNANRLRVKQIYFQDQEDGSVSSFQKAKQAFDMLLSGGTYDEAAFLGTQTALQVPDTLMTLSKVREYLGPSLMLIAGKLEPGEFTTPKRVSGGYKIVYLVDKENSKSPELSDIKNQVLSEFKKRRDDQSLRDYLEDLKSWYDISRNLDV